MKLVTRYWVVQINAPDEIELAVKHEAVKDHRSIGLMVGILLREALEARGVELPPAPAVEAAAVAAPTA